MPRGDEPICHATNRSASATAAATAMVWPVASRAQQARPIRKIGVLLNYLSGDLEGQARMRAFATAMRNLGWIEGENLQTEIHFAGDEADLYRG